MTADQLSRLERLTQLFKDGALSEEEFNQQKAVILTTASQVDLSPSPARPAPPIAPGEPSLAMRRIA